jgi:PP-loop superfamily ATP-utilizing enzyme
MTANLNANFCPVCRSFFPNWAKTNDDRCFLCRSDVNDEFHFNQYMDAEFDTIEEKGKVPWSTEGF